MEHVLGQLMTDAAVSAPAGWAVPEEREVATGEETPFEEDIKVRLDPVSRPPPLARGKEGEVDDAGATGTEAELDVDIEVRGRRLRGRNPLNSARPNGYPWQLQPVAQDMAYFPYPHSRSQPPLPRAAGGKLRNMNQVSVH